MIAQYLFPLKNRIKNCYKAVTKLRIVARVNASTHNDLNQNLLNFRKGT